MEIRVLIKDGLQQRGSGLTCSQQEVKMGDRSRIPCPIALDLYLWVAAAWSGNGGEGRGEDGDSGRYLHRPSQRHMP